MNSVDLKCFDFWSLNFDFDPWIDFRNKFLIVDSVMLALCFLIGNTAVMLHYVDRYHLGLILVIM